MGLSLVLNLEQTSYMGCGLTQSAGARVAFNVATVQSFIDEYGMNVQPATSTDFALKTVSIELLFPIHMRFNLMHWP